MKRLLHILMLLPLLAGCTSKMERQQKKDEAAIAPRRSGDIYTFKIRPASDTYELRLAGVTQTSAHLGPDFTVQYFTFALSGSLGIYHGGHPQDEEGRPMRRFSASFGKRSAKWSLFKEAEGFRASAYVLEPEREDSPTYIWHLMVSGKTEQEVHAIIQQLRTFRHADPTTITVHPTPKP